MPPFEFGIIDGVTLIRRQAVVNTVQAVSAGEIPLIESMAEKTVSLPGCIKAAE
jgi:hypothetical protein